MQTKGALSPTLAGLLSADSVQTRPRAWLYKETLSPGKESAEKYVLVVGFVCKSSKVFTDITQLFIQASLSNWKKKKKNFLWSNKRIIIDLGTIQRRSRTLQAQQGRTFIGTQFSKEVEEVAPWMRPVNITAIVTLFYDHTGMVAKYFYM